MTDHTTDLDEVEPKPWLDSIEGCLKASGSDQPGGRGHRWCQ